MRRRRVLVLLVGCLLLFCVIGEAGENFSMGGSVGAIGLNGDMYYRVALQPVFNVGKLKAGFNLSLTWNDTEGIKPYTTEDWVNLILFIQWAEKGEKPLYFRLGDLQTATLGHGFIVNRYSNMTPMAYNNGWRNIGLEFDLNMDKWGLESIFNNILGPNLYGARVYVKPLKIAGSEIPILSELAIGVNYATDIETGVYVDTYSNLAEKNVQIAGADLDVPLIDRWLVYFFDFAQMLNHGNGWATGFMGGKDFSFLDFAYRFEYHDLGSDFIPAFFDSYYEFNKPKLIYSPSDIRYNGWYGEVKFSVLKAVGVLISYEDSFNGTSKVEGNPRLHGTLTLSESLFAITKQKISLSVDYDHKNFDKGRVEDSSIQGNFLYGVSENVDIVYIYTQKYTSDGNPIRATSIETRMHF